MKYKTRINNCLMCNAVVPADRKFLCSKLCAKRRYGMKRCKTSRFKNIIGYEKTETGIGLKWEKWFAENYNGKWMNEKIMSKPYDIDLNGQKIDVKVASYYIRKMKRGKEWNGGGVWNFKPNAFLKPEIDYYACICLDNNNEPLKVLYIPSAIYNLRKGLTIGKKSNFDLYNIYQHA